jgi:peptidoglycan biosynthesis protein MviN/MurJ (putative lipid II flippase)
VSRASADAGGGLLRRRTSTIATPKKAREARAGMAMSLATFAMAAASAIQAVLYLSLFGTDGRTDGFFVAFALYTTFGVFSQSLRLTAVPLLVNARMSSREFAAALAVIALPVVVFTIPLAGPVSQVLAPGLGAADRAVTESALPVLGGAMALQLWAAGAATLLAVRAAFGRVAGGYIAGAGAGLATFLALMNTAGELTLGWSMFAMAVVTCAWMLVGVRATGGLEAGPRALRAGRLVRQCGLILGRTAVYLAFNMLFVVTLAFASHSTAGDATVLSYAYLFASYLVAGTGMALGMSRIPDMTRAGRDEKVAVLKDTVPPGFRYSILIVAPALALLITAGAPFVHRVFPDSLGPDGAEAMRTFTALLVPWTIAALLVNFLLPAMFATGRARLVNALAVPLLAVHLVATLVAESAFGIEGAIAAFAVAPAGFAVVLLVAGAGPATATVGRELLADGVRFLALSAATFGGAAAAASTVEGPLAAAVAAGALGSVVYAAGLALIARRQLSVLAGSLLRPASA